MAATTTVTSSQRARHAWRRAAAVARARVCFTGAGVGVFAAVGAGVFSGVVAGVFAGVVAGVFASVVAGAGVACAPSLEELEIEGVLLTMYDDRTNLAQQVTQNLRDFFKDKLFKTVIPRNVRLAEAPSYGKPVMLYGPRSRGAESYQNLADELLGRNSIESPQAKKRKTRVAKIEVKFWPYGG